MKGIEVILKWVLGMLIVVWLIASTLGFSPSEQGKALRTVWQGFTSGLSGESGTIALPSGRIVRVTVTM